MVDDSMLVSVKPALIDSRSPKTKGRKALYEISEPTTALMTTPDSSGEFCFNFASMKV